MEPTSATVARGERFGVKLSVTNTGDREVETRVLYCPLLIPVRLAPGATRDFVSEYLLLADSPEALKVLEVTYTFPAAP